ncbi:PAS domain S-box protein [Alkaliflexus imshenetskii]|uniref:PAS domain S-box protein n=1 Tax=Alkaliflexus imshenetskii TaxID=286730 RepID=UPI000478CE3D|nr:PAS domain S-box protein [Alkaliflexus imshenetskii]
MEIKDINHNPAINSELIAENRALKHLLNKVSGISVSDNGHDSADSQLFLPLSISSILMSDTPFHSRLESVLQLLGDFTNTSRVYIFENAANDLFCRNTYEWCNKDVTPQIEQLQHVSYHEVPSWMPMLKSKGSIESADIVNELPEDIVNMLVPQEIKSILVLPIITAQKITGFIGFDECKFQRKWSSIEKAILGTVSRLISNAYQQHNSIRQIRNSLQIQQFLFEVSTILNQKKSNEDPLVNISRKMVDCCNLSGIAIYVSDTGAENVLKMAACATAGQLQINFPERVEVPYDMPSGIVNQPESITALPKETAFPDKSCLMAGIRSFNGVVGLLVMYWDDSLMPFPMDNAMIETITGMLAGHFDHKETEKQNLIKHREIIKINKLLAEKEHFLNSLIRTAPIGIILVKDRIIQYVNDHVVEASLFPRDFLIGRHASEFMSGTNAMQEDIDRFYHEIISQGVSVIDMRLSNRNGKQLYYQITGTQASGFKEENYFLLIGQDMTQVKHIENSLIESEERNRKIIEANIDGIFIITRKGKLVYVNQAGCELTGYYREQLMSTDLASLFPTNNGIKDYLKLVRQIRSGIDYRGDFQLLHKSGSLLYVEIHGTLVTLEGEDHLYFSLHDITRRKRNEAALELSEKKFRSLSENLPDCVARINLNGLITYSNTVFSNIFGLNAEGFHREIMHLEELHPDFADRILSSLDYVSRSRRIVHLELDYSHNGEVLTFDWSLSPELDENCNCISILGIGRNITSRKKTEQELLLAKEKAEAADRLKSAFLANMSHEIRTPLNAIVGFSNLLGETDPDSADREEFVSLINRSADNLMALINDIIDIAKIESGHMVIEKKAVDIMDLMDGVYKTFNKRVETECNGQVKLNYRVPLYTPQQVLVDADPLRLLQIFNNLLDNAIKFTHKGHIELGFEQPANNRLKFFVRDTGIGISSQNQNMIFEAFRQEEETPSKKYGGTGLGLTICKKLTEAMGGSIGLISEKQQGSEFYFYLNLHPSMLCIPEIVAPIAAEPTEQFLRTNGTLPNWNNKMLLLIDDNSSNHLQLKKQLEKTRITLLLARSGSTARQLLMQRNDIDAVILSQTLPDMASPGLVSQLRQANIRIPIIVQGVDIKNEEKQLLMHAGVNDCLNKPVQVHELIQKIQPYFKTEKVR